MVSYYNGTSRMKYTVVGLIRSGTNYLKECIRLNIPGSTIHNSSIEGGIWTHAYNVPLPEGYNIVYSIKHPYSWIESISQRKTFTVYRTKIYYGGMIHGKNKVSVENAAKFWVEHVSFWLKQPVYSVTYESFLGKEKDYINSIAAFYKDKVNSEFILPKVVPGSETFNKSDIEMYKTFDVRTLDWQKIKYINSVAGNLAEELGYKLLKSEQELLEYQRV